MEVQISRTVFIGFNKLGRCWRFRFSRDRYFSARVTHYSFWRLYLVHDRTLARRASQLIPA